MRTAFWIVLASASLYAVLAVAANIISALANLGVMEVGEHYQLMVFGSQTGSSLGPRGQQIGSPPQLPSPRPKCFRHSRKDGVAMVEGSR